MLKDKALKRPIILIGAARSGTTILGNILSKHPNIAYWVEPKYVWKYRSPDVNNDIRMGEEVTKGVKKYIHSKFLSYQRKKVKSRFLEKTPSNCFRIPFIEQVFPDAIYINILRDGRDVTLSALKMWTLIHKNVGDVYKRRLSYGDVPLRDLPFYGIEFARQYLRHRVGTSKIQKWGPITPEILEYLDKSVEEACAYQWYQSTEMSVNDLKAVPVERVMTLKYEHLIRSPEQYITQIMEHCRLPYSEEVMDFALDQIRPNNHSKWKSGDNMKVIDRISYILNPMLYKLEYLKSPADL